MNRREFLKRGALIVAAPAIVRYDSLMRPVPLRQPVLTSSSMDITIDQLRDLRRKLEANQIPPDADGHYYLRVGGEENIAAQAWANRVRTEIMNNLRIKV